MKSRVDKEQGNLVKIGEPVENTSADKTLTKERNTFDRQNISFPDRYIVHLSDLHFGEGSRFKDRDPDELGRRSAQSIRTAMKNRFENDKTDLVVVTGDLTRQASKEEFDQALRFFKSLQNALDLSQARFVFVPGNHDLSWEACKFYFNTHADARTKEFISDLGKEKFALFDQFKSEFYNGASIDTALLDQGRGAVFHTYSDLGICIAALNSCERETDEMVSSCAFSRTMSAVAR